MYWMRQCVSGGDRRVVDPETNLHWPHLLRLVSSLCSSRPRVPVGKCTTPSYHILLPALYAGLNKPVRLLIFDELKMKAEWKYWIISMLSCSGFLHRRWTFNLKLYNRIQLTINCISLLFWNKDQWYNLEQCQKVIPVRDSCASVSLYLFPKMSHSMYVVWSHDFSNLQGLWFIIY
jgi:hypothetical protein